jgi:hypothetical protein
MGRMRGSVKALYSVALIRVSGIPQKEFSDRPNRVEFGFSIDHVFKVGRNFQVRNDAPKCLG